jgi:hypothetical protein
MRFGKNVAQGLMASSGILAARLKPCPDTKHKSGDRPKTAQPAGLDPPILIKQSFSEAC